MVDLTMYYGSCFVDFQEADINGDGTLDKEEFIYMFDDLFGLKGKVI